MFDPYIVVIISLFCFTQVGNYIDKTVGSDKEVLCSSFWFCIWRLKKIAKAIPKNIFVCRAPTHQFQFG